MVNSIEVKTYTITPVSKPRMTQRDKWKKRPAVMAYRAFKDECRLHGLELAESGNEIVFVIPMPESWSKKKRAQMSGQPHQQRPDVDNLLKAVMDAVFDEDSHLWSVKVSKVWGEVGLIIVKTP